ncbi:MAG: 1-acyl-sn-glycerol-3-phosphate acyltransferase, partial [Mycobacterium sp.]
LRVESLQLPGDDRRELAARCEAAVRGEMPQAALVARPGSGEGHALVA